MIIKENGRLFIALPDTYTLGDIERFRNGVIGLLAAFPPNEMNSLVGDRICDICSLLLQIGVGYEQMDIIENGRIEEALSRENVLTMIN